jgi:hypothetical protein
VGGGLGERGGVTQGDLFADAGGERIRSPICSYQTHCGATALLGDPEDFGACVNRTICCERCGATGTRSTRKDLAHAQSSRAVVAQMVARRG